MARVVKGERVAPADLWSRLTERFALIGVQGIVRMAMSGFDMAAWDALAVAADLPLATLIGSAPRPIPAYNSCGLGLMTPDKVADEAEKLLAGGFRALKLRLGYPTLRDDLAALRAVKKRVGSEVDGHGGLQSGAQPGAGARTWPRARSGRHLLAGRADPAR